MSHRNTTVCSKVQQRMFLLFMYSFCPARQRGWILGESIAVYLRGSARSRGWSVFSQHVSLFFCFFFTTLTERRGLMFPSFDSIMLEFPTSLQMPCGMCGRGWGGGGVFRGYWGVSVQHCTDTLSRTSPHPSQSRSLCKMLWTGERKYLNQHILRRTVFWRSKDTKRQSWRWSEGSSHCRRSVSLMLSWQRLAGSARRCVQEEAGSEELPSSGFIPEVKGGRRRLKVQTVWAEVPAEWQNSCCKTFRF